MYTFVGFSDFEKRDVLILVDERPRYRNYHCFYSYNGHGWVGEWMDGCVGGWMGVGWVDGWIDGWAGEWEMNVGGEGGRCVDDGCG